LRRGLFAALLALTIATSAFAGELTVSLPGHEALALTVPSGWAATVRRDRADLPPTVVVTTSSPGDFQMLVTPIWPMGGAKAPTLGDIQGIVERAAAHIKPQAVEASLPLQRLDGPEATGFYFSATDRAPEPDGYKYLTQGTLMLEELRVTFTILANGEPAEPTRKALDMLKTVHRVAPKSAN
jgi:hypothetical protein